MSKNILKPHKFKTNLFDDSRGHLLTLDLETNLFLKHKFKYELFSYTAKKNIFRGMHFQKPPFEQNKLLILIKGKITDMFACVVVCWGSQFISRWEHLFVIVGSCWVIV